MSEQSDTPRTTQLLMSLPAEIVARQLERELTAATRERDEWQQIAAANGLAGLKAARERDEARALNVEWAKKAETWMASPEAAQRLQGYRDLAQQVAQAQNERDEARAALLAIKLDAASLADAQVIALESLAATESKP